MARCLAETGCLIVRDPRVGKSDNETFLNLMERYFEQPDKVKLQDARPALHYQVSPLLLKLLASNMIDQISKIPLIHTEGGPSSFTDFRK